jgi:hypothetical protein
VIFQKDSTTALNIEWVFRQTLKYWAAGGAMERDVAGARRM